MYSNYQFFQLIANGQVGDSAQRPVDLENKPEPKMSLNLVEKTVLVQAKKTVITKTVQVSVFNAF